MSITQENLDASVWGTGYGSRKHLVDHEISRARVATNWGYSSAVKARCSAVTYLEFLDSCGGLSDEVLACRKPCVRCQKIADVEATR